MNITLFQGFIKKYMISMEIHDTIIINSACTKEQYNPCTQVHGEI